MPDSDRTAEVDSSSRGGQAHLVLAKSADAGADAYCRNRLESGDGTAAAPLTVLTSCEVGGSGYASCDRRPPGVVVAVGDEIRGSCDGAHGATAPDLPDRAVSPPDDLESLGRTVDDYLTAWADSGYRPVVCVDSLTGLLWEATVREAYRFLYVLRRRIEEVDGELHVHVNPVVHEEEIVRTFFAVVDRVVAFDDGGSGML